MQEKKKIKKKPIIHNESIECRHCGNTYVGKNCNLCGEKVFLEKHLTVSHFFKQILDFFYHYENKVLRSIKLNFIKPGFITSENLNGITVPYAKPIQLFLVVNVFFYLLLHFTSVSDYTPAKEDHNYFPLSMYAIFNWAKPFDNFVVEKIDQLKESKIREYEDYQKIRIQNIKKGIQVYPLESSWASDSLKFYQADDHILSKFGGLGVFQTSYDEKVSGYSKSLIFLIIPFAAIIFFLFIHSKIKYFGSALIFATHFIVYNMCFFSIHVLVDWVPYKLGIIKSGQILSYPIDWLFYNKYLINFSEFIFGGSFEMLHFIFWFPWLFSAFKRIVNLPIWKNILISYFCCRIFFFLIFGIYKKFLIAFSLWML